MNPTHLMIIGFGSLLLLLGVLAPDGGWNIYVMILGFIHIAVGNVLVFRQLRDNLRHGLAEQETDPEES